MTKLEALNYFILQFFFIRRVRHLERAEGGECSTVGFSYMYWVCPFTGWGSSYKFLGKQNFTEMKPA